jgi:hypothetical protein
VAAGLAAPRRRRLDGWQGFCCWAIVGALFAFAFVTMASIGLFVLPLAVVVGWLISRYVESGLELLGLAMGAGLISLAVGVASIENLGRSCPATGTERLEDERVRCGGVDPLPWLLVGTPIALMGVGAFGWFRHRVRGHATK